MTKHNIAANGSFLMALNFGGVILPVSETAEGHKVVPVKPIVEAVGIDWKSQYRRVSGGYLARRLGTCMGEFPHAGQSRTMLCIRLDRVSAYLYTLNPDQIRGSGNEDAADFLERKHEEWDTLLHQYELAGGMFTSSGARVAPQADKLVRTFLAICRERRAAAGKPERDALGRLATGLAQQLGIPYQLELGDEDKAG